MLTRLSLVLGGWLRGLGNAIQHLYKVFRAKIGLALEHLHRPVTANC